MNNKLTPKEEREVVILYNINKKGIGYISNIYKVDPKTIWNYLKKNNISLRKSSKKYYVNEEYFKYIDSPEKAYWLGFITADGCITGRNYLKIGLSEVDQTHLIKFRDLISPDRPLHIYAPKIYKNRIITLCISSQELCSDLNRQGVIKRKTFNTKFPDIDKQYERDFIRGYFDGDGSINYYNNQLRFSILGTELFLKDLQGKLVNNCNLNYTKLVPQHKERCKGIYAIVYGGNKQVSRIYDYLYKSSKLFLERKEVKFRLYSPLV